MKTPPGKKSRIEEGRTGLLAKSPKKIAKKKRRLQTGGFCKVSFRR
jgi:hypothetical protein